MTTVTPPAPAAPPAVSSPPARSRQFVPVDFDPADWSQIEPLYGALQERALPDSTAMETWLRDWSELSAAISEVYSRRRIRQSCFTEDAEAERAFLHFVEDIIPKTQPVTFELQKKFLAAPGLNDLLTSERDAGLERYALLEREWRADVELFREANIPLQVEETRRVKDYDSLVGAMEVDFRGKTYTLPRLARFLEEPDRATRQEAWELTAERRLRDREAMDTIFDDLLSLRKRMAENADLPDYRAYVWKSRGRFDYTPQDTLRFNDAIQAVAVPLVERLDRERREALGVEAQGGLRPWDLEVDPHGRAPLTPFDAEDVSTLVDGTRRVFERVSPELAEQFGRLEMGRNLDLESRRAKRPGGYQSSLSESGEPFIFMNAAGSQRDVETMLHEGGHAFHFLWAFENEPLTFLQHAPLEFCEVASMSMELIAAPHLEVFYENDPNYGAAGEGGADRARRRHLEGIVRFFPWMATIDQFQHWLYTHEGHTSRDRQAAWLEVLGRFSSSVVDWSGHEQARQWLWQRQLHVFHYPFYYVEYGIAQLGALQLWLKHREDPAGAVAGYRKALALGGTRKLPELFEAAGLRFALDEATLRPLLTAVMEEVERLPA